MLPTPMSRRALLIFAHHTGLDRVRRRLPRRALPLLRSPALQLTPNLGADVHVFGFSSGYADTVAHFHQQHGKDFAERFENAIEHLATLGYEEIVAIGRDCPALSAHDIAQAFDRLADSDLVLGPDHRGGCYLIGFRACDRALLHGIRWNRDTDCAELSARVARLFILPTKHDIDSWADLRLAARADGNIARLTAFLFSTVGAQWREVLLFVHASAQFVRLHNQLPPPRATA